MIESWQLAQRQSLPLEAKVIKSQLMIRPWYEYWHGNVYVAFSGGKDSTVLLDLVRKIYPNVPAVFCDTGLEYPEIREFVKSFDNVVWVKPKMNFKAVLEKYGYPVLGKRKSRMLHDLQNPTAKNATSRRCYLEGIRSDGSKATMYTLSKKWQFLVDAPFSISDECCNIMKKGPSKQYEKETGRHPYLGMMASDSNMRRVQYMNSGCNAFENKRPVSTPMGPWLEEDVWEYIRSREIPYCKIYDMGEHNTGCVFCMFGVHMEKEPNRFQRMKVSHPKLWKYCMDKLGLRDVLNYMGIPHTSRLQQRKRKYVQKRRS